MTLPPEFDEPRPRPVSPNWKNLLVWLGAGLFVTVVAAGSLTCDLLDRRQARALVDDGVCARVTAVGKGVDKDDYLTTYKIRWSSPDAIPVGESIYMNVPKRVYDQVSEYDAIPITYLPSDPSVCCLGNAAQPGVDGTRDMRTPWLLQWVPFLAIPMLLCAVGWIVPEFLRHRRLAVHGIATIAVVESCAASPHLRLRRPVTLRVHDPTGGERLVTVRPDQVGFVAPGQELVVVHEPFRIENCLAYANLCFTPKRRS